MAQISIQTIVQEVIAKIHSKNTPENVGMLSFQLTPKHFLLVMHTGTITPQDTLLAERVLSLNSFCTYSILDNKRFAKMTKKPERDKYRDFVGQKIGKFNIGFQDVYLGFIFDATTNEIIPYSLVKTPYKVDNPTTETKVEGFVPKLRRQLVIFYQDNLAVNETNQPVNKEKVRISQVLEDEDVQQEICNETNYPVGEIKDILGHLNLITQRAPRISEEERMEMRNNFEKWVRTRGYRFDEMLDIVVANYCSGDFAISGETLDLLREFLHRGENYSKKSEEVVAELEILQELASTTAYERERLAILDELYATSGDRGVLKQRAAILKNRAKKLSDGVKSFFGTFGSDVLSNAVAGAVLSAIPTLASQSGAYVTIGVVTTAFLAIGIGGKLLKRRRGNTPLAQASP